MVSNKKNNNEPMYSWAKDLFPITRSITGPGVRETLNYLKNIVPNLIIKKVKSGEKYFDWKVPDEWFPKEAWVKNQKGKKVIDFKKNNLHLVGYSKSIKKTMRLNELKKNLYSLASQPNAIPYVTSYYNKQWGFCLKENDKKKLKNEKYDVFIDAPFKKGFLNYGEIIIRGKLKKEIFLSTYICHPSLANNEISGPVVAIALSKWIKKIKNRKYTYRIVFLPETIGSIIYISKNLNKLKKNVIAGFNITCVGDTRCYSYIPSRNEDTLADKVSLNILKFVDPKFKKYSWLDRGSDERQYCAPGIDLPVVTICRSKFGTYPEYHTSLDNLNLISSKGLETSLSLIKKIILSIENNQIPKSKILCEPQMGRRKMYPTLSIKNNYQESKTIMDIISYCDGKNDLIDISNKLNISVFEIYKIIKILKIKKIIT
mgnify:CR=1 FL=1